MKKLLIFILAICATTVTRQVQAVNVTITTYQSNYDNTALLQTMQSNLSAILTEINAAKESGRDLNVANLQMDDFAKRMLVSTYSNTRFYCDDDEIVEEGLPTQNGMLIQQIPFILLPDDDNFGKEIVQFGTVEFDKKGIITDFRFALDTHTALRLGQCQSVVETERRMQILKYVEHFRTAYCQKDINFLRQVFSDDALIITGNVVTSRETNIPKITYKKQGKEEYLSKLSRAFARNKFIDVKFQQIGERGYQDDCGGITQSKNNPNWYGVTLFQEWKSSNYNDEGFVFLLWDFTDEAHPVIHVRTWQPEFVGDRKLKEEELFTADDFSDIKKDI